MLGCIAAFWPRYCISSSKAALITSSSYHVIAQPGPQSSASDKYSSRPGISSASCEGHRCSWPLDSPYISKTSVTSLRTTEARRFLVLDSKNFTALVILRLLKLTGGAGRHFGPLPAIFE